MLLHSIADVNASIAAAASVSDMSMHRADTDKYPVITKSNRELAGSAEVGFINSTLQRSRSNLFFPETIRLKIKDTSTENPTLNRLLLEVKKRKPILCRRKKSSTAVWEVTDKQIHYILVARSDTRAYHLYISRTGSMLCMSRNESPEQKSEKRFYHMQQMAYLYGFYTPQFFMHLRMALVSQPIINSSDPSLLISFRPLRVSSTEPVAKICPGPATTVQQHTKSKSKRKANENMKLQSISKRKHGLLPKNPITAAYAFSLKSIGRVFTGSGRKPVRLLSAATNEDNQGKMIMRCTFSSETNKGEMEAKFVVPLLVSGAQQQDSKSTFPVGHFNGIKLLEKATQTRIVIDYQNSGHNFTIISNTTIAHDSELYFLDYRSQVQYLQVNVDYHIIGSGVASGRVIAFRLNGRSAVAAEVFSCWAQVGLIRNSEAIDMFIFLLITDPRTGQQTILNVFQGLSLFVWPCRPPAHGWLLNRVIGKVILAPIWEVLVRDLLRPLSESGADFCGPLCLDNRRLQAVPLQLKKGFSVSQVLDVLVPAGNPGMIVAPGTAQFLSVFPASKVVVWDDDVLKDMSRRVFYNHGEDVDDILPPVIPETLNVSPEPCKYAVQVAALFCPEFRGMVIRVDTSLTDMGDSVQYNRLEAAVFKYFV